MALDPSIRAKAQQGADKVKEEEEAPAPPPSITHMDPLPCDSWFVLLQYWRKAVKWIPELEKALAVMLASVTSTKTVGDPLFVKLISPASSGKSTLCDAISICSQYVEMVSTMTSLYSGFVDNERGEDCSLLSKILGKTLIVKDGDTLLSNPAKAMILGQLRDAYDGKSSTHYGNKQGRKYAGRFSFIICGTSRLRSLDSSDLGERTLDCVIMERIDDDLEDEIAWRAVNSAHRNLALEADGKAETHYDEDMVRVMRMTSGYVTWLRENANARIKLVDVTEPDLRYFARLGKFISYMRARPAEKGTESERELAVRLPKQITRLAICMAVVMNRVELDKDVLDRVHQVALDTARGQSLNLVRHLYGCGNAGAEVKALSNLTLHTESEERKLLRFLRQIGAVETCQFEDRKTGILGNMRWRLSTRMRKLYGEVMEPKEKEDSNAAP